MLAIIDSGPLVAYLDRAERYHRWTVERIEELEPPLLVCEPVLTEATYLLGRYSQGRDALLALLENGALALSFQIEEHVGPLRRLLQKYRDTPMSLADACVVCMAEIHERHAVLTLDSDFLIYRKHARVPLGVIHPARPS